MTRKTSSSEKDNLLIKEERIVECVSDANLFTADLVAAVSDLRSEIMRIPGAETLTKKQRDSIWNRIRRVETRISDAVFGVDDIPPELESDTVESLNSTIKEMIEDGVDTGFSRILDFMDPLEFERHEIIGTMSIDIVKCLIPGLAPDIDAALSLKRLSGEI